MKVKLLYGWNMCQVSGVETSDKGVEIVAVPMNPASSFNLACNNAETARLMVEKLHGDEVGTDDLDRPVVSVSYDEAEDSGVQQLKDALRKAGFQVDEPEKAPWLELA